MPSDTAARFNISRRAVGNHSFKEVPMRIYAEKLYQHKPLNSSRVPRAMTAPAERMLAT